jgi:hypothetical protein
MRRYRKIAFIALVIVLTHVIAGFSGASAEPPDPCLHDARCFQ